MAPTFSEATAVQAIDSHTYRANLHPDWAVGSVPHGGVVTSVFLKVAQAHFSTTLAAQDQPNTITLHLEFLRRTQAGPATLTVLDTKLGRQTSTVHITLTQGPSPPLVVGYLTNTNMSTERGPTLDTAWSLHPPPPTANLPRLKSHGTDGTWHEVIDKPFPDFRRIMNHVHQYLPLAPQAHPSLNDQWLRLKSPPEETTFFTDPAIGLVSDLWPQVIETMLLARQSSSPVAQKEKEEEGKPAQFWYPTLVLNLNIKKTLPPGGAEWLFVRVRAKSIRNGREDLEVVVLDGGGELVAVSHHVALVLGAERNLAKKRGEGGEGEKEKL